MSIAVGVLSGLYHAYDVIWPNHFVGDMYGIVVFPRVIFLVALFLGMIVGVLLWPIGNTQGVAALSYTGQAIIVGASVILLWSAVLVARSRAVEEVRKGYPDLPVQELLRLARDEKDQFALDAIIIKGDPAAVPGLSEILLDKSERGNLRCVAAQALGTIGGPEARAALEKAKSDSNPWLIDAVRHALVELEQKRGRQRP